MIGYIMFRLGDRPFACRLDEVREVVRLDGLEVLPGMTPPISGVLELRGNPLPVVDLRAAHACEGAAHPLSKGDVLVMATGIDALGVVVDQVTAVHDEAELVSAGEERPSGLPDYVTAVLRHRGALQTPVLLVDLHAMMSVAV
jgi:chemotaxis signal transduction protein